MNERIRELYEQAHERKPVMVVDPQTGNPIQAGWVNKPMYHNEFNPEKFAELIVRECVNVALEQKKQVEEMEVYNLQDEVWNRARIQQSEHIVDKIKQHFGVKE